MQPSPQPDIVTDMCAMVKRDRWKFTEMGDIFSFVSSDFVTRLFASDDLTFQVIRFRRKVGTEYDI